MFIILFSFSLQILGGCGSSYPAPGIDGKKYTYLYQLVEPVNLTKLDFIDSQISISFSIDDAAISYTILNLTNKTISIESGSAMLGIDSTFTPVRNIVSLYSDSVKGFAPLNLPARGSLSDIIIPRNNIYWSENGWTEKDLFATLDSGTVSGRKNVTKNIGRKLVLILPVKTGDKKSEYVFKFKVAAIRVLPPEKPFAEKHRPPAPSLYSGNINPWITVSVAAGIALVSGAIILAQKKPVGPLN